jgi:hypothetical protein
MHRAFEFAPTLSRAIAALLVTAGFCHAQTGYGVNAAGTLFRFNVNNPSVVTTIGNVGFVPEGIDFRPSSSTLYAIDIGPNTSQLYTINITSGAATPVGAGFPSVAAGSYDLTVNSSFGFDFNPATLQGDGSMRIRLVSTAGVNLRLNSSTGTVAAVDVPLLFGTNSPFVDGIAYSNNIANSGGTTTLYDMDARNDSLYIQNPPNNGTLNLVGPFGVTIDGNAPIHLDILTPPGTNNNFGYAVYRRPNAPQGGPLNSYLLYDVNLANGATLFGRLVGPAATPFSFEGGFSVLAIPEPAGFVLLILAIAATACATACCRR